MSTVVHFLCHHWRRHLAYASLCAYSLIHRGKVEPSRIVATLTSNLRGTPEAESLRLMGVRLSYVSRGWHSKMLAVDAVFAAMPEVVTVVQLDTDCVLTEDLDFLGTLEGMSLDSDYAAYLSPGNGSVQLALRKALFLPAYSPYHPEGWQRLNALTMALLGVDWLHFTRTLEGWIYGGLTVYRRSLLDTRAWSAMKALAWVTCCDETIMQLVRAAGCKERGGALFMPLDQNRMPHRVCPMEFSLTEGRGMIHYAGDWYRENAPDRRAVIAGELYRIFGLELTTDGPTRPAGGSPRPFDAPGGGK